MVKAWVVQTSSTPSEASSRNSTANMCTAWNPNSTSTPIKQVKRERAIEENQAACDAELKQLLSFMSDVDANNATIVTPDDSDDEDLGSLVD